MKWMYETGFIIYWMVCMLPMFLLIPAIEEAYNPGVWIVIFMIIALIAAIIWYFHDRNKFDGDTIKTRRAMRRMERNLMRTKLYEETGYTSYGWLFIKEGSKILLHWLWVLLPLILIILIIVLIAR